MIGCCVTMTDNFVWASSGQACIKAETIEKPSKTDLKIGQHRKETLSDKDLDSYQEMTKEPEEPITLEEMKKLERLFIPEPEVHTGEVEEMGPKQD